MKSVRCSMLSKSPVNLACRTLQQINWPRITLGATRSQRKSRQIKNISQLLREHFVYTQVHFAGCSQSLNHVFEPNEILCTPFASYSLFFAVLSNPERALSHKVSMYVPIYFFLYFNFLTRYLNWVLE